MKECEYYKDKKDECCFASLCDSSNCKWAINEHNKKIKEIKEIKMNKWNIQDHCVFHNNVSWYSEDILLEILKSLEEMKADDKCIQEKMEESIARIKELLNK